MSTLAEFWAPNVRDLPPEVNRVRRFSLFLWHALVAGEAVLVVSSLAVFFVPAPAAARLAVVVFVTASIGVSLTSRGETRRYAMPVEPLRLMCGMLIAQSVLSRRHLVTTETLP